MAIVDALPDIDVRVFNPLARAATDSPFKLHQRVGSGHEVTWDELGAPIRAATDENIIVTPHFVPQRNRVDLLARTRARGVRVVVITNSFSLTNDPLVHGGCFPYSRALLRGGVDLHEARADRVPSFMTGEPYALTLHAKAPIADRRVVDVGSLKQDPHSIVINSVMG